MSTSDPNTDKNAALGQAAFAKSRKVSSELFGLTYGALVAQLLRDLEDVNAVNNKLDQIGESMGIRLADEVLAKSGIKRCGGVFKEAVNLLANVAFRMYWGVSPKVGGWNEEDTSCVLTFGNETPLEEFVDIPEKFKGLRYSQVLCGIIRGGLGAVSIKTKCEIVKDRLLGADVTEVRIDLIEIQREMAGEDYREE
jgi:hypothetical protein